MTKPPFRDGDVAFHPFDPVALKSKKIKVGSKLIPSRWKAVAWIRKRSQFWAIVYEIEITSETDFQVKEVSVLGLAQEPPLLDEQGLPYYQVKPMQKVAPVARWQLIEASNKFNELAHKLFADVKAWAKTGFDKPFMAQVSELHIKAKKSASARARLSRISKEYENDVTPKKRISWSTNKLKELIRRAEEIDRELDLNEIGDKQRDRNARLAVEFGVSVKTIEQRLSEARQKGFGSKKPKGKPQRKGK